MCAKDLTLERNLACSKRSKGDRWLDNREGGERGVGDEMRMNAKV